MIRITVVYLGGSRGQSGCAQEELELPDGSTLSQARRMVAERHPGLEPHLSTVRWARNLEFTTSDEPLANGDELALVPPVSGGAPMARLGTEPIDPAALLAEVADPQVGATVLFVGTVRDHARGKRVERLEYEAYEAMAERQLERIAQACTEAHRGVRMAIAHRHGKLEVGDVSVAIAAASAHRAEAFDACRMAIERIKVDVPIFKREIAEDGATWVDWGGG